MTTVHQATLTMVPKVDEGSWTDRELFGALVAKDSKAPILAYRRYAPRIFGIVQRSLGPSTDAEDLTQDIFLRVFARVHTLRNPDALSSFVLSVALRVIKWQLRQLRVRRILCLTDSGFLPDIAVPGLDSEGRQALRRLYQFLDALPTAERTVFVLRQVEGMNLQEVADAVGASLSTVKRRLRRSLDRLDKKVQTDSALKDYAERARIHDA